MVQALTKRNKAGELYVRPPAIEAEITSALLDDLTALRRRLHVIDKASPDYLHTESLVHIIRDALRTGDEQRRDAALMVLLVRCEAILKAKISNQLPNAEHLREEILSEFCELFAVDGTEEQRNELDFYECRFHSAFRTLRIDMVTRELDEIDRVAELPDEHDPSEPEDYEDTFSRVSEAFRTPATQESNFFLDELWTAINALPPDERAAVILVCVMGYDEESDAPEKVTAATLCKCTGRTIRNRLSRAAAKLSRFKEDT